MNVSKEKLPHIGFFSGFTGSSFQTRVSEASLGFQKKVFWTSAIKLFSLWLQIAIQILKNQLIYFMVSELVTGSLSGIHRSSCSQLFFKISALQNFSKFTGKHLLQSLFFNKKSLRLATSLKKRLWHSYFPVNFAKFLRTPFLKKQLRWLLLPVVNSESY